MQEQVHDYLGTLPSTKFFFLYLVGQNVDYDTLKALSHKIYELVTTDNEKVINRTDYYISRPFIMAESKALHQRRLRDNPCLN